MAPVAESQMICFFNSFAFFCCLCLSSAVSTLAIFDELPQDPAGIEDNDPEALTEPHEDEHGFEEANDIDAATLGVRDVVEEAVMVETGNDAADYDDAVTPKPLHGEQHDGAEHGEGQGLMRDE